ncbi:hypothetical protein PQX77_005891 [Marasmius sp. AFHP31]|nr:hypothetical protein PQX77_005891 [Marasmius sp. AFHP31]
MFHLWGAFSNGVDENTRPIKEELIRANSQGVVLDLGAGFGHSIRYLDRSRVTRYIAVEPNVRMHTKIRQVANASGFLEEDGSLAVLGCGAGDVSAILKATEGVIDTIVSVLSMCSLTDPKRDLERLVRDVLKPGGQLVFYEHVLNPRDDVAWWQGFYAPVWSVFFDGCRLHQPTDKWVENMKNTDQEGREVSMWREGRCWADDRFKAEEALVWHVAGRFVKTIL